MKHLLLTILLIAIACVLHFSSKQTNVWTDRQETVQLLPESFDAQSIDSIVMQNPAGSTTLFRSPEGWRIKEKWNALADREEIDSLIFALCAENAKTTQLTPDLLDEAGFPPAASGASITICDKDGNAIAEFIFGKTLNGPDGSPQQRYVRLQNKQTALTPYLALQLQRSPQEWLQKELPGLGMFRQVTCIRQGKLEWSFSKHHQHFELDTLLDDDKTANPAALDRLIVSLSSLTAVDVLPSQTSTQQTGLNRPTVLSVTREDGVTILCFFGTMSNGLLSLQLIAQMPQTLTTPDDRSASADLQASVDQFNARHTAWIYVLNLRDLKAVAPPLEDLTQPLSPLIQQP